MSDESWTRVIRPKKNWSLNDLRELWVYRELLYFFSWRDLKVRYKQTTVGVLWAIFQPLATMVVFSVIFGKIAKIPSDGIPYPIFVYSGLLFWQFFSTALADTSNTLVSNAAIVTKVYFPRLLLPLADAVTKLIDFCVASTILAGLMVYYRYLPSPEGILLVPILLLITFLSASGSGLILSAINVKYRDVRYVLPFFIQMLVFVTPVIYPTSLAGKYAWLLAFNPMTGVINNARAGLLGTGPVEWVSLMFSLCISLVLFSIGVIVFKKTERIFADVV